MNTSSIRDTDVLIVGAGPTGLVLALWLTRLGVRVRIVDKTAEPGTSSRALAVQARTLELYRQIGLADAVVSRGRKVGAANLWVAGKNVARAVFGDMGAGLGPFPYVLVFPQDEHEQLLIDRLAEAGVKVERQTEFLDFDDATGRVLAHLRRSDGTVDTCQAAYLAGCDGARSTVREALQIGFPGGTYAHLFYVADVEASGAAMNGEVHVALDTTDFLAVFPLKEERHARLIGTVRADAEQQHENLSWHDVSRRAIEWMSIDVERVRWFSTYHVHHRVADHFRKGCAFVLGDAAHIHSPVGGQGMNTGIGDAVNLAWKLAAVVQGRATASLLDSYEPERIAFARRLVATTDRAFTAVTSPGPIARRVRLDLVPLLIPALFALTAARRFMFRTISQTAVSYRGSRLSEGRAGTVHGGDRLPWVKADMSGVCQDNFTPLTSLDWQVHVYGDAAPEIQAMCEGRQLPLHVFPWRPEMGRTGLRRNAAYLVRPDGYVALADPEGRATPITSYLDARKLTPNTYVFDERRRCRFRGASFDEHTEERRQQMRVMVIVKASKESEAGQMPSEKLLTEMGKFNEDLVKAGVMLAGDGLHPSSKGKRVRFSGGNRTVIDGPFAETKELIAGFWLWRVKSIEDAVEWLKRAPFDGGTEVEIRPVFEADDFGKEFTPELRAQEERLRAQIEKRH